MVNQLVFSPGHRMMPRFFSWTSNDAALKVEKFTAVLKEILQRNF